MALHTIKIAVVNGGRQLGGEYGSSLNKKNKKDGDKGDRNSLLYKALNYNNTIKNSISTTSPAIFFAAQAKVNLATHTMRQSINYYISDIGRRHGDSNYQAIVGRQIEISTDVASIFSGALGGAATGSMFGPIGAAVGAIFGIAGAGSNLGFKYAERERTYQHELFKEDNSLAYRRSRADVNLTTGRLR